MFNANQKQEIAKLVSEKINEKKISQQTAATQTGMSVAYMNHIVNNKVALFDTISDEMWSSLASWVSYNTNKWATYESDSLNSIFELCNEAQEDSRFLAVIGDTGDGKTKGLTYYASKTKNCYYVLGVSTMTRKGFLERILKAIGIDFEGSADRSISVIIQHFRDKRNCLLIIDDMGKVPPTILPLIQQIYDETEGLAGMVWGGLPTFKNQFFKFASKGKAPYPEMKRRVAYWMQLNKISPKFIVSVAATFGITEEPALKLLLSQCDNYGTFKNMMVQYERSAIKNPGISQRQILAEIRMGTTEVGDYSTTKTK